LNFPLKSHSGNSSPDFAPSVISASNTYSGTYEQFNDKNIKTNFMSLDRNMKLSSYSQPKKSTYSTNSLNRDNAQSPQNQYPLSPSTVPTNISQINSNLKNSTSGVSPKVMATSSNYIPQRASSQNYKFNENSLIMANGSPQLNSMQITNNLYLQNSLSPSNNNYGVSPQSSSPTHNMVYSSLPRDLKSNKVSPSTNPAVQILQRSHSQLANTQRNSLPVMSNINPNSIPYDFVAKSNSIIGNTNINEKASPNNIPTPIRQDSNNNPINPNGINFNGNGNIHSNGSFYNNINGQEYRNGNNGVPTSSIIAPPNRKVTAEVPPRKDSNNFNSNSFNGNNSFILENSFRKYSVRRNNSNLSNSFISHTSSQSSNNNIMNDMVYSKVLPDNINDPVLTPRSNSTATESIKSVSQPIDIPKPKNSSSSEEDSLNSSFSSYRSSNYVITSTLAKQTDSIPAEVSQSPSYNSKDHDSYNIDDDFDLEPTHSIPRSNSDDSDKKNYENLPSLLNSSNGHDLLNSDAFKSTVQFSNLLDVYTEYLTGDSNSKNSILSDPKVSEETKSTEKKDENQLNKSNTLLGVAAEIEKEILKKRSTLKSKDRIVADEILRKISISNHTQNDKNNNTAHSSSDEKGDRKEGDIGIEEFNQYFDECIKQLEESQDKGDETNKEQSKENIKENVESALDHENSLNVFRDSRIFTDSTPSIENFKNFIIWGKYKPEDLLKDKEDSSKKDQPVTPNELTKSIKKKKSRKEKINKWKFEETILQPTNEEDMLEKSASSKKEIKKETEMKEVEDNKEVKKNIIKETVESHDLPSSMSKEKESIESDKKKTIEDGNEKMIENGNEKTDENRNNKITENANKKKTESTPSSEPILDIRKNNNIVINPRSVSRNAVSKRLKEKGSAITNKDKILALNENKSNTEAKIVKKEISEKVPDTNAVDKIDVILKKNSDRGHNMILPETIKVINKENKDEKPFIPSKSEVKQLIDRSLSNISKQLIDNNLNIISKQVNDPNLSSISHSSSSSSSSQSLDNGQFFWAINNANTEVHPLSPIFKCTNSLPEKLLGTIPSRKKSYAESAYVITRDNINDDVNGQPVIDPKNYIRYRRSRVIWEHYNNLKNRTVDWSSDAIIRSKTIGSCHIKGQNSVNLGVKPNNVPTRSHTTDIKSIGNGLDSSYSTPTIESLKSDNKMINERLKKKDDWNQLMTPSKQKENIDVPVITVNEAPEVIKSKPSIEGTKKVQISEKVETIEDDTPGDSSLTYSKTIKSIYETQAVDEGLKKIEDMVEENRREKRSGWYIWFEKASKEGYNRSNSIEEQKQISYENNNNNLLRKMRRFGVGNKKNKKKRKEKKKEKINELNKQKMNDSRKRESIEIELPTPTRRSSLSLRNKKSVIVDNKETPPPPLPKRQSSISRRSTSLRKKKATEEEENRNKEEEEVPYTKTLKPLGLGTARSASRKEKKHKSKLSNIINTPTIDINDINDIINDEDDDLGYSSDSSISSISSLSSASSVSSFNKENIIPLSTTALHVHEEIFHDENSDFSDFASSPGSPLFSNMAMELPNTKDYITTDEFPSPSIPTNIIPDELLLPSANNDEPKEIFSEHELSEPATPKFEMDVPSSPKPAMAYMDILDPMQTMETNSSAMATISSPNYMDTTNEREHLESIESISRNLQKAFDNFTQQQEKFENLIRERQQQKNTILREEIEALKRDSEWRKNCIQQQKIIKQKQMELQDQQQRLQMEQELLQQQQRHQQEVRQLQDEQHRLQMEQELLQQHQKIQLQEIQLSHLKLQLEIQQQEQQIHYQQMQNLNAQSSSSQYYDIVGSRQRFTQSPRNNDTEFDDELYKMYGISNQSSTDDKMDDDQNVPSDFNYKDISMDIGLEDLLETQYDSDDSAFNSDYSYSDITTNSEFSDSAYDSTASMSEYSVTYNDRLHIYNPEDDIKYARFDPLVEKALYQLSYNKLSYSKRSLHQQVVIRNFMIYYFTLNMERTDGSSRRSSSMHRRVPRLRGVSKKRSRSKLSRM